MMHKGLVKGDSMSLLGKKKKKKKYIKRIKWLMRCFLLELVLPNFQFRLQFIF